MHTTPDLLDQLRREWRYAGRTPSARRAVIALRARHPDVALGDAVDLTDVVAALETRGGRTVLERARIVTALLEESHDPAVRRALLQTLVPGVVSVCRQLRFGRGIIADPGETVGLALSHLSELIADWAGQTRAYAAPDLLSALRGRLRRTLLKEKDARGALALASAVDAEAPEASTLEARLLAFAGGPDERLARLTYARVFEGRAWREVARDDHCAPVALQGELRLFALRHLL